VHGWFMLDMSFLVTSLVYTCVALDRALSKSALRLVNLFSCICSKRELLRQLLEFEIKTLSDLLAYPHRIVVGEMVDASGIRRQATLADVYNMFKCGEWEEWVTLVNQVLGCSLNMRAQVMKMLRKDTVSMIDLAFLYSLCTCFDMLLAACLAYLARLIKRGVSRGQVDRALYTTAHRFATDVISKYEHNISRLRSKTEE